MNIVHVDLNQSWRGRNHEPKRLLVDTLLKSLDHSPKRQEWQFSLKGCKCFIKWFKGYNVACVPKRLVIS